MEFKDLLGSDMSEGDLLHLLSTSKQLNTIAFRDEEVSELENIRNVCRVPNLPVQSLAAKINILIRAHISRVNMIQSTLMFDMENVIQKMSKLLYEILDLYFQKKNTIMVRRTIRLTHMISLRQWDDESPFRQFQMLSVTVMNKIQSKNLSIQKVRNMQLAEVIQCIRNKKAGSTVKRIADAFPYVLIKVRTMFITETMIRIRIKVKADFTWDESILGETQAFWLLIENFHHKTIQYYESFMVGKKQVMLKKSSVFFVIIPLLNPKHTIYCVRVISTKWMHVENWINASIANILLPRNIGKITELAEDMQLVSTKALQNKRYERFFGFKYFNKMQSQVFKTVYSTDNNIFLGAPNASGKKVVAELAILHLFNTQPNKKVIYITPWKSLAVQRYNEWNRRFGQVLGKRILGIPFEYVPSVSELSDTDIIVTTPEIWSVLSRNWEVSSYIDIIGLLIVDEIHLIGDDRGSFLEAVVTHTKYLTWKYSKTIRIVGLSYTVANTYDIAYWLNVPDEGLFNFGLAARHVELKITTINDQYKLIYPQLSPMIKTTFEAIQNNAPNSQTMVFVSSHWQVRLTAMGLIPFLRRNLTDQQWVCMDDAEIKRLNEKITDNTLRHTFAFGVGMYSFEMVESDRQIVRRLFAEQKIQVIIATSNVAWMTDFKSRMVIIKGVEHYDNKTKRHVDMSIAEILQICGRAGRRGIDSTATAVLIIPEIKEELYKNLLCNPLPVESNLFGNFANYLYGVIANGTIKTRNDALEYLFRTYMFRRWCHNPSYYGSETLENRNEISESISNFLDSIIDDLEYRNCCILENDGITLKSTTAARIGANFCLDTRTISNMTKNLSHDSTIPELLETICRSYEFHEASADSIGEMMNMQLSKKCRYKIEDYLESPFVKAYILMQCHLGRISLPTTAYQTSLKSILQVIGRIMQAYLEFAVQCDWLQTCIQICHLIQMVTQGYWYENSHFLQMSVNLSREHVLGLEHLLNDYYIEQIPIVNPNSLIKFVVAAKCRRQFLKAKMRKARIFTNEEINNYINHYAQFPIIQVELVLEDGHKGYLWKGPPYSVPPITVLMNHEYFMKLNISYMGGHDEEHTPVNELQQAKQQIWTVLLSNEVEETVVMKQDVINDENKTIRFPFFTPARTGTYLYNLHIISKYYLGLDQDYRFVIRVLSSDLRH